MRRAIVTFTSRNYWQSTYVQLRALQHVGCWLPVVIYHPADDPPPHVLKHWPRVFTRTLDSSLIATAGEYIYWPRTRALLTCGIDEVLVLGADVYPVADPEPCFDDLRLHEAVFWREIPQGSAFEPHIYGLPPEAAAETFTPQGDTLLLNLKECSKGVELTNWFNERGQYYFPFGLGDQTQWRAAWALLGWPQFSYASTPVDYSRHYVYVHQGRDGATPLFVHRTGCKFATPGTFALEPRRFDDLPLENEAWGWQAEWRFFR